MTTNRLPRWGLGDAASDQQNIIDAAKRKLKQAQAVQVKGQVAVGQLSKETAEVQAEGKKAWTVPMLLGAAGLVVIGGGLVLLLVQRMMRR